MYFDAEISSKNKYLWNSDKIMFKDRALNYTLISVGKKLENCDAIRAAFLVIPILEMHLSNENAFK